MNREETLERLYDATRGRRDLDYAIYHALTGRGPRYEDIATVEESSVGETVFLKNGGVYCGAPPPHYTTNFAAARSLIPHGSKYEVQNCRTGLVGGHATVFAQRPGAPSHELAVDRRSTPGQRLTVELALCTAAFQARLELFERFGWSGEDE